MSEVSENAVETCIKYFSNFFFFVFILQTLKYATNADIKKKFYAWCCCCGVNHAFGSLECFFCSHFHLPSMLTWRCPRDTILHLNEHMQHFLLYSRTNLILLMLMLMMLKKIHFNPIIFYSRKILVFRPLKFNLKLSLWVLIL